MPADKPQIVILSSIDWETAWQRHQIFASQFAADGREVFFVENTGFRNPGPSDLGRVARRLSRLWSPRQSGPAQDRASVSVLPPRVLPPTFAAFRRANARWLIPELIRDLRDRGLRSHPTVVCYFATATTLEIIRRLSPALLVYDCASNFRAHPSAPNDFPALEASLLARADLVVCDSDFLYRQKKSEHGRVVQIHQGVSDDFFDAEPPSGRWRRFCYYGTWARGLDARLVAALAEGGLDVTVSGYVKEPAPALPATVARLAPTTRADLPRRLERFDAFLMPYEITPFHLGVVPAKIYECLALGRPVIATPLPSLKPFADLIYTADTPRQWLEIARGLPKTETAALRQARVDLARRHTHRAEFERLLDEMGQAAARR